QRVLNAVAKLGKNRIRYVERILGHEINADTFRSDQLHHLRDLLKKSGRRIGDQQMRLVEKEYEARFFRIAHFGKILEQLRQEAQQEGRIELRRCHELVGSENIDKPAPVLRRAHYVLDVKRRFTEEIGSTLLVEHD